MLHVQIGYYGAYLQPHSWTFNLFIKLILKGEVCISDLFMQVASTLGMKKVFKSPYYLQCNGHIEYVHTFLKMCVQKHVSSGLTWDEVVHTVCAVYNFVQNEGTLHPGMHPRGVP